MVEVNFSDIEKDVEVAVAPCKDRIVSDGTKGVEKTQLVSSVRKFQSVGLYGLPKRPKRRLEMQWSFRERKLSS